MWGGGFHGFDGIVPTASLSRASMMVREEFIRRALEE